MTILLHTLHMKHKVTYPLHTADESLLVQKQKTGHKDRAGQRPV